MIINMITNFRFRRRHKERAYVIVDRHRTRVTGCIYYNAEWPALYYVPTIQDAIARHVANNIRWENGDMFLVFRMGKRPPVVSVVAMFERMDGTLTARTISDYPDDVKEILAHLRKET